MAVVDESVVAAAKTEPESLVGHRVRVAGNLATVRWGPGKVQAPPSKRPQAEAAGDAAAAPAEPATVEVLGIEYDAPDIGKHDGTHQGTRLFQCENGKGSFVKVDKAEFGISIQRALAEKYFANLLADSDAAKRGTRSETVDAMEYTDSKGREKEMNVDFVGRYAIEQRQQRLEAFVEMALADANLSSRYPEDIWEGDWSLPNLRSLWLDQCLIGDWSEVVAMCGLCPQLEWLSLVRTRLASPPAGCAQGIPLPPPMGIPRQLNNRLAVCGPSQCKIKTLVLSGSMVTWTDILRLDAAGVFPVLQHLHLGDNKISEGIPELLGQANGGYAAAPETLEAQAQPRPLPYLQTLILDGNDISDWQVIRRAIAAFPSLKDLHLNRNLLGETLAGLAELGADETPRCLTGLFLNENRLSSWGAVGALSAYALLELKTQRNAITEGSAPVASTQLLRQVLIALMPSLLRLNASEIPVKERTAAERYLLGIAQQPGNKVIEALSETCDVAGHVARLKLVHGDVVGGDVTEEAQATRSALVNTLVEIRLRPIGAVILDRPEAKKRVPHTMTVAELKRLAQQLFKQVPLPRVRLILADPDLPFGVPFDDESRELGFYGICDGAEIRVDDSADSKGDREIARVDGLAARMETTDDV